MGRVGHSAAGAADAIETANRARADRRIVISRTSIGRQAPLYSMAPRSHLTICHRGASLWPSLRSHGRGLSPRLPHPTLPRVPGRAGLGAARKAWVPATIPGSSPGTGMTTEGRAAIVEGNDK